MTIADGKMLIKTPLGTLVVYPNDFDESHPGLSVDLRRPGLGVDAPLVYIEFDGSDGAPELVTRVWGDVNFDDATDRIAHEGIKEFFTYFGPGGVPSEYPPEGE